MALDQGVGVSGSSKSSTIDEVVEVAVAFEMLNKTSLPHAPNPRKLHPVSSVGCRCIVIRFCLYEMIHCVTLNDLVKMTWHVNS